ncbi:MAG: type III pantothenate kinase [Clostridia bacterium]|nr:type III pantothenate kinase [Clostridia bacterium]
MILVIDVGNTNIKLALCSREAIVMSWRVSNRTGRTADEFGVEIGNLFATRGYSFADVEGVIMSSVVPSLNYTLTHACKFYMKRTPIMVDCTLRTGLTFGYADPHSLGADRIANAVGAVSHYGAPAIVVDLGTASTFGVIDRNKCFLGGCIAPGIKTGVDALSKQASQLPLVELTKPASIIADSTITNIQAGAIYGFSGLVKSVVQQIKAELGDDTVKVIATGGLTELLNDSTFIDVYDRALTLKGLLQLYLLNA